MNYGDNGGLSASDVALLTGNHNNSGFGDGNGWWIIILLLALGGWNNGFGGNNGGGNGAFYGYNDYAWLSNGQKEIMQNTNDGFNTLQLANQLTSINTGVQGLSTQLCGCCGDIQNSLCNGFAGVNSTVNAGFANAETSANARQMANMQQAFNNEIATLNGFNNLNNALSTCCCENRLATCQTQNIVQNESNATRFADANNTRDIITNATANTQAILDKLCQLELDNKQSKIADLERQNLMLSLDKSQTAQNAFISQGFANEVDQLYNRLNNCPINTVPVFRKNANIYLQQ